MIDTGPEISVLISLLLSPSLIKTPSFIVLRMLIFGLAVGCSSMVKLSNSSASFSRSESSLTCLWERTLIRNSIASRSAFRCFSGDCLLRL